MSDASCVAGEPVAFGFVVKCLLEIGNELLEIELFVAGDFHVYLLRYQTNISRVTEEVNTYFLAAETVTF